MEIIEDLLANKGLYDSINITIDNLTEMEKYLSQSEYVENTIDCYCVQCATRRVFEYTDCKVYKETGVRVNIFDDCSGRTRVPKKEERYRYFLDRRYALTYRCTRDKSHTLLFDLITTNNSIIKIGQYPSVADLVIPEISKYKAVLGQQYRELSKAVGLFAHGIGIGSFVYLRRIIENLVFDIYKEKKAEIGASEEEFARQKFDAKIEMLKAYLPAVLVQNKNLYGIVSKGIHELSEDECNSMFPCVRMGIELMLDEQITTKERQTKEKEFSKFVAQKTGELKQ